MAKQVVTITIGGVDYSSALKMYSLRIYRKDDTKNQAQFTLTSNNTLYVGQEVVIKIDSVTYFGGLVQNAPKELITHDTTVIHVLASSYEQVCTRRTLTGTYTLKNAGDIVQEILDKWIGEDSDYSEGFKLGQIDDGTFIQEYKIEASNISQIFQDLAEASGYKWWIDDNKFLYFMGNISYSNAPYEIDYDTNNNDRLKDLRNPRYDPSLEGYRTREFVVGKKVAGFAKIGAAINVIEEDRMKTLYGSGVYGHVTINRNVTSQAAANTAAMSILSSYDNVPGEFTFKTPTVGFDVAQKLEVTFPLVGINTMTTFYTDWIVVTDYGPELMFEVHAVKKDFSIALNTRQRNDWTEEFGKLKNSGDNDTYDKYLYVSNTEENVITTGYTTYTLLADLEVDSHVFSQCMFKGVSSADQIIEMSISQLDIVVYTATYQAKTGVNSFYFEYPLWAVAAAEGIDFDLNVKTTTGTFTIPALGLTYWIKSVGLIGGESPVYPSIDVHDVVHFLVNFVNNPSEDMSLETQTPAEESPSESVSMITFSLRSITESVGIDVVTP